jgi:hypothetical protein
MEEDSNLNINELSIKCQSKKEVYSVLQVEGHYYLPPLAEANSDYISDVVSGDKKVSIVAT